MRINSCLAFFILGASLAGCSGGDSYYNKTKARTPMDYDFTVLKGTPRQIKELTYQQRNDSLKPLVEKNLHDYILYTFDRDSNLLSRAVCFKDSPAMVSAFRYSKNGYSQKSWVIKNGGGDTSRIVCKPMGNGRFRFVSLSPRDSPRSWLDAFSDGGNKMVEESYRNGNASGHPYLTVTTYYDGQKILKKEGFIPGQGMNTELHFYSKGASPDSVTERQFTYF